MQKIQTTKLSVYRVKGLNSFKKVTRGIFTGTATIGLLRGILGVLTMVHTEITIRNHSIIPC